MKEMSLQEFRQEAAKLPYTNELFLNVIAVEPLEGRNALDVDRKCIVEDANGKRYVTQWD